MGIKKFKPTTPGQRKKTGSDFSEITRTGPEKSLTKGKKRISGRNNMGRITVRFRGGGHKRKLRKIDFLRDRHVPGKIISVEYDPNRSARISLLQYIDGEKRYILTPIGVVVGDTIETGSNASVKVGSHMQIKQIPVGSQIHNIEMKIGKGGQLVRSAGAVAQLVAKDTKYAQIRLPSSEIRRIHINCSATMGQVGNSKHELRKLGKAGRKRWLGFRPHNRGVSMNPVDHPLGGGEGKSSGGRHPVTPWGIPTKGHRTRNNKRTDKFIVSRRK